MNAKMHSGNLPPRNKNASNQKHKKKEKKWAIVNRLTCATLEGVNAKVIEVEATSTKGIPSFQWQA